MVSLRKHVDMNLMYSTRIRLCRTKNGICVVSDALSKIWDLTKTEDIVYK